MSNPVWEQSLKGYVEIMLNNYNIKEFFIIGSLDSTSVIKFGT